jgi:hypothetical protein
MKRKHEKFVLLVKCFKERYQLIHNVFFCIHAFFSLAVNHLSRVNTGPATPAGHMLV